MDPFPISSDLQDYSVFSFRILVFFLNMQNEQLNEILWKSIKIAADSITSKIKAKKL